MFGLQTLLSALILSALSSPLSADDATLLFVTRPDCPACLQVAPLIHELAANGHSVEVVDATKHADLVQNRLGVSRFPTFLLLSHDKIIDRVEGGGDPNNLKPRLLSMFRLAENSRQKGIENTIEKEMGSAKPSNDFDNSADLMATTTLVSSVSPANAPFSPPTLSPILPPQIAGTMQYSPPVLPAQNGGKTTFKDSPKTNSELSRTIPNSFVSFPKKYESESRIPWVTSSVKLRVDADNTHSWGTGTIVDARNGKALILTCGHIFRDSNGKGDVEVHLFGSDSTVRTFGKCLYYDIEIDLAIVVIAPPCPVQAIPIAPEELRISAQ
ncbi:MAG: trypsin-like peptidase domain-containing protein, partial [Thermoguttaceae bacterium]